MISILQNLEPRIEEAGQILYEELDEIEEIIFITEGSVDVGYDLNRNRKFVLRFDKRHVIGIFNCTFDVRAMFVYMSKTKCTGYFLRKRTWKRLLNEYTNISNVLRYKVHEDYTVNIKTKVLALKNRDLNKV